jgi:hypothetical protein
MNKTQVVLVRIFAAVASILLLLCMFGIAEALASVLILALVFPLYIILGTASTVVED